MCEALTRDEIKIAVTASIDHAQMALNCSVGHCFCAQISEHAGGVGLARRFHNPGDHKIAEHGVVDDVETEPVIHRPQHVVEQPRLRCRRPSWSRRDPLGRTRRHIEPTGPPIGDAIDRVRSCCDFNIEHTLVLGGDPAGPLKQNTELRIGVC